MSGGEILPARALHFLRHGHAREVEESWREIHVEHQLVHGGAFAEKSRIAHKERDAERFIVERAFVAGVMLAEVVTVVAGIDDDGVFGEAERIERVEQADDVFVHAGDVAEVVEVGGVVGEALRLLVGFCVGFVEDGGHAAVRRRSRGFTRVEAAQALGQSVSAARAVRAFETDNHRERLFTILLHPLDGEVRAHVIHPAFGGRGMPLISNGQS